MSASAARRILDSANPRVIRALTEGCVRCSVDEREHSEHDEGAQVPRWKSREPVCHRISMRQHASSPREKWIQEIRGKRLQRTAEGASSASRLASSSAASFPGKKTSVRGPIVA